MRTARSLTVSRYLVISHACPPGATTHAPEQPCTPPQQPCIPLEQPHMSPRATTHAPPRSNHACPPRSNHACPLGATTHTPWEQPCMTPLWTECGHMLLKILPCPNFVAGGNNSLLRRNKKIQWKMVPLVGIEPGPLITSDSKSNTILSGLSWCLLVRLRL